jgi:hypothetical protein
MSLRKGQFFTPDFAASVVLFSMFLLIFGLIWNSAMGMFIQEGNIADRQHQYTFSLLKTSGTPVNWNSDNVELPGFYSDGFISAEKFAEFKSMGVKRQEELLRSQNFYLEIQYLNGSTVSYEGGDDSTALRAFSGGNVSAGNVPEDSSVYASKELSVLKEKGKRVELQFYSWSG